MLAISDLSSMRMDVGMAGLVVACDNPLQRSPITYYS